jgi:nicotinate-nucleotide adenylyltransferase
MPTRRGLLGGTFDPVHLGHLRAAENAREALGLEDVRFVPARLPPHRPEAASSALDRFAMVALATATHPRFVVSDLELRRDGPSYTIDTVSTLRQEHPGDELVLIVGSDTFPEMESWRELGRLLELCHLAVVPRPGGEERPADWTRRHPELRFSRVEADGLAVSATEVRRRAREGKSIRYLVPDGVADYIAKRGLYR